MYIHVDVCIYVCVYVQIQVSISGAVHNPLTLSMDQIVAMETITFPCTVTCAGEKKNNKK